MKYISKTRAINRRWKETERKLCKGRERRRKKDIKTKKGGVKVTEGGMER